MKERYVEPILWRAVRPTAHPDEYFEPCSDGILFGVPVVYATASALEAFMKWCREEVSEYHAGKVIIIQTPPRG